jgi:hypothetical protein
VGKWGWKNIVLLRVLMAIGNVRREEGAVKQNLHLLPPPDVTQQRSVGTGTVTYPLTPRPRLLMSATRPPHIPRHVLHVRTRQGRWDTTSQLRRQR